MKLNRLAVSIFLAVVFFMYLIDPVIAGELSVRLAKFPHWDRKIDVSVAVGDLFYPEWFAGTWDMEATLVDMIAPLAPDLVTPGFEGNRNYLNRPISARVRFIQETPSTKVNNYLALPKVKSSTETQNIIADRAFNGLNLATAYLGKEGVVSVSIDRDNPNRQITILPGDRQLISQITGRKTENPSTEEFLTTEIFQQIFQSQPQIYLNEVETTSNYRYQTDNKSLIVANQITAIYLSPQDPNYFKAKDKPVALYRYQLKFTPAIE